MNITIAGAGNIGTQFAVHCAEKGHRVTIYGSRPESIKKRLSIVNECGTVIHEGEIFCATNCPEKAFADAELIFITMPAYCMKTLADQMKPYVKAGVMIGLIPGTGGGECAFRSCIENGAVVFGLQRVPSVARLVEYGRSVCATGYRDCLYVAALPYQYTDKCSKIIEEIFDMRCENLPNYLNLTLTPSNPILHTTRLRTIFKNYKPGIVYESLPLFYEDWDDETSKLLFACDAEVQQICDTIQIFDLSYVKSLRIHYESPTVGQMSRKISSIAGFKGLKTPATAVKGGFIPDFNSRYFTADFPYGLSILVQVANLVGVAAPNMHETLQWYYDLVQVKEEFRFSEYGIKSLEEFVSFYGQ